MKNEYRVTKELMQSFATEYPLYNVQQTTMFAVGCAMAVLGLNYLAIKLFSGFTRSDVFVCIGSLCVAIYYLFFARRVYWRRRYRSEADEYEVEEWMRSYEFLETEIVCKEHTSTTHVSYESIRKIKEKGNVVILMLAGGFDLRLYKNAFTEGSWEECKALLDERVSR